MIGIAIRTFIIDFGLNIMFDKIRNNFVIGSIDEILKKDPKYLIYGELLELHLFNGMIISCRYKEIKTIDYQNIIYGYFADGRNVSFKTNDIKKFVRLDYENVEYDSDGRIYIDDDEEIISDEKIINWLKEKRDG